MNLRTNSQSTPTLEHGLAVSVGSEVMVMGGYPMIRGCLGIVTRMNSFRKGHCYVKIEDKLHSCRTEDLLIQNKEDNYE